METLVFTLDTIALMVVIYFSFKGERAPGKPELGPFRIRAPRSQQPGTEAVAQRGRRR